jgi:predicted nucleic acid-binding protein
MSIPLLYLDTSAWLKLYVEKDGSEAVNAAVEQAEQTCTPYVSSSPETTPIAK